MKPASTNCRSCSTSCSATCRWSGRVRTPWLSDAHYGALLPRYADRFAVRPGLTGFAQVQGLRGEIHDLDCMARRIDADCQYAASWSFRSDLMLILRTVPMLVKRVNAY